MMELGLAYKGSEWNHCMKAPEIHAFPIHRALSLPFANSRSTTAMIGDNRGTREWARPAVEAGTG
jgi:hypothetical protein